MFQSNYYLRSFWIDYNKNAYSFLKTSIINQYDKSNRIHIFGNLFPYEADIYAIEASNIALREIGLKPEDYYITNTMTEYYTPVLEKSIYEKALQQINKNEQLMLNKYFRYNQSFSIYEFVGNNLKTEDNLLLKKLFQRANIIPNDGEDFININLLNINK